MFRASDGVLTGVRHLLGRSANPVEYMVGQISERLGEKSALALARYAYKDGNLVLVVPLTCGVQNLKDRPRPRTRARLLRIWLSNKRYIIWLFGELAPQ